MKNIFIVAILTLTTFVFSSFGKISAQSYRNPSRGIYDLTEVNLGYGLQGDTQPNVVGYSGLTTLLGYWFNPKVAGGAGVGIFAYNGSNAVPVYLEGGYYFNEFGLGKMRFFFKADAGLLLRINSSSAQTSFWGDPNIPQTRFIGNPLAGIMIPIGHHKDVSISLGFYTQWDPNNQDNTQNSFVNFINAKVGVRFY